MPRRSSLWKKKRIARMLIWSAAGAGQGLLCLSVPGAMRTWIASSGAGSWSVAGNWSPSGAPDAGDDVIIPKVGLSNATVTYDYTGPTVVLNSLNVSGLQTLSLAHTSYLTMSANTLQATDEYFGDSGGAGRGRGVMNQSGGTNIVSDLYLGNTAQSSGTFDFGTYNLSDNGFLHVGTLLSVGQDGGGEFNQTGGLVEPEPGGQFNVYVGFDTGANGTYTLSGGTLTTLGGSEEIGYHGAGTFNQSAGTNDLGAGQLHLGEYLGSAGYYNLSGTGVVKAAGLGIGFPDDGTAVFDQTGGTVTIGGLGIANNHSTASGSYKLEDGSLTITGGAIYIAGSGTGSFIQTGGTVSTLFPAREWLSEALPGICRNL